MKIIKRKNKQDRKLRGRCHDCGTRVECVKKETKELIDRDTQPGMATLYVKCPECDNSHLWVE